MPETATKVMADLKTAFAGESQANRKYTAWAKKAEEEGHKQIARLFRATAEAETIHALGHFEAMGMVKSTKENLGEAISGETYEFQQMYPPMFDTAQKEGHPAKRMFYYAMKIEEYHANAYKKALESLEAGKDLEGSEVYLCPVCGHIHIGKPESKCPVCGAAPEKYKVYD
ncbi:MAG: rubrerythrin family protein [Elusimicrobiota bacterium]